MTFIDPRPSWDEYYLGIAKAVSVRGDCTRRQIGAVIVVNRRIASCGYNGTVAGEPGCLQGFCPRGRKNHEELAAYAGDYSDCIATHAEANALLYAGRERCIGGTLYVTEACCSSCSKLARAAGIERIVHPNGVWHLQDSR